MGKKFFMSVSLATRSTLFVFSFGFFLSLSSPPASKGRGPAMVDIYTYKGILLLF